MPQCCNVPTPTKQMLKAAERISCHMPLNNMGQCRYKICPVKTEVINYEVPTRHLDKTDKYWSNFLRAQSESTANYLYKIDIFGDNKDTTLVKRVPFPNDVVHQRLLRMPYIGGLLKGDMVYILSFILNVKDLSVERQMEYMQHLQNWKLLDLETLNYMLIMARHQNAGLTQKELQQFQSVCQHLIERVAPRDARNYFNPDYIFIKCMVEIDPYELAFLKYIMKTEGRLEQHEFLYLVNFVERLQEMPLERRDQYLKLLMDKNVLETARFDKLVAFMRSKSKKADRQKLKLMLNELFKLMDIGPCFPEPEEIPVKKPTKRVIGVSIMKLWKALTALTKPGIPNIVRVMDLKKFLLDCLWLEPFQVEDIFSNLKALRILNMQGANFIEKFIVSGQLGKGDPEKKKRVLQIMKQVMESPPKTGIIVSLEMPPPKGPYKTETIESTPAAPPAPAATPTPAATPAPATPAAPAAPAVPAAPTAAAAPPPAAATAVEKSKEIANEAEKKKKEKPAQKGKKGKPNTKKQTKKKAGKKKK